MWRIYEHRDIEKAAKKIPSYILKKYELWKKIVAWHGPQKLKEFSGFSDEALKGKRAGQRSSRLSKKYRVIYQVNRNVVTIYVLELTAHRY